MGRFIKGLAGFAIGFTLFVPFFFFTSQSQAEPTISGAPLAYKIPMIVGLTVMYLFPLLFWALLPAKDRIRRWMEDRKY